LLVIDETRVPSASPLSTDAPLCTHGVDHYAIDWWKGCITCRSPRRAAFRFTGWISLKKQMESLSCLTKPVMLP